VKLTFPTYENPHHKTQFRLLVLAGVFLFINCLVLTFAPAIRVHQWTGTIRWEQWVGWLVWLGGFSLLYRASNRHLPDSDPYLIPLISLLTGWGLMTIFRLNPALGFRQTVWLALCIAIPLFGIRFTAAFKCPSPVQVRLAHGNTCAHRFDPVYGHLSRWYRQRTRSMAGDVWNLPAAI